MLTVTITNKDLLYLLNFCHKDLTENRGLNNLILTKIAGKAFLVATNGSCALFQHVDYPEEDIEDLKDNHCLFFKSADINKLKAYQSWELIELNFNDQTWMTNDGLVREVLQFKECNLHFQNWLYNFCCDFEPNNDYNYIFYSKELKKFMCDKTIWLKPVSSKIMLVKFEDRPDLFGFICKKFIDSKKEERIDVYDETIKLLVQKGLEDEHSTEI